MPGLLADVNVQGHLEYLRRLMRVDGLLEILTELGLSLVTFSDVGLNPGISDRVLWQHCQEKEWVLFTENRNHEDEDSLNATLQDSWHVGHLPVLTLANKGKFENNRMYAATVAKDIATQLFDAFFVGNRDQPRIFVPIEQVDV
jgi:hypothetical protein